MQSLSLCKHSLLKKQNLNNPSVCLNAQTMIHYNITTLKHHPKYAVNTDANFENESS